MWLQLPCVAGNPVPSKNGTDELYKCAGDDCPDVYCHTSSKVSGFANY